MPTDVAPFDPAQREALYDDCKSYLHRCTDDQLEAEITQAKRELAMARRIEPRPSWLLDIERIRLAAAEDEREWRETAAKEGGPAYRIGHWNDLVAKVRESAQIVDVMERCGVDVDTTRNDAWARCPWHNDRTASLHIDPDRNLWLCFSCGSGGDVFTFLTIHGQMDFRSAVIQLADWYGIDTSKPAQIQYFNRYQVAS
jgi:hypothetical protein